MLHVLGFGRCYLHTFFVEPPLTNALPNPKFISIVMPAAAPHIGSRYVHLHLSHNFHLPNLGLLFTCLSLDLYKQREINIKTREINVDLVQRERKFRTDKRKTNSDNQKSGSFSRPHSKHTSFKDSCP